MSPDAYPPLAIRSWTEQQQDRALREDLQAWERDQARIRADEDAHQADRRRIAGLFGRPPGALRRLERAERLLVERTTS